MNGLCQGRKEVLRSLLRLINNVEPSVVSILPTERGRAAGLPYCLSYGGAANALAGSLFFRAELSVSARASMSSRRARS